MSDSPYILDVTRDNYEERVVENSRRVPVLVDFWAPWCGPCQMQMPVLTKLADAYGGKFLVAKVNTDEERELAARFGIRSIPTMKLFRDGDVVEDILGAQTESALRALLDRHVERESDRMRAQAMEAYGHGDVDAALALLRTAAEGDPDNPRLALDHARLAMDSGRLDAAEAALTALPYDRREDADIQQLLARLEFARLAADAPPVEMLAQQVTTDGADLEARYRLAAHQVLADQYEEALDNLLTIMQRDRGFRDDAARKGMLAVFNLLGNQGDVVSRYRSRLFNALH